MAEVQWPLEDTFPTGKAAIALQLRLLLIRFPALSAFSSLPGYNEWKCEADLISKLEIGFKGSGLYVREAIAVSEKLLCGSDFDTIFLRRPFLSVQGCPVPCEIQGSRLHLFRLRDSASG